MILNLFNYSDPLFDSGECLIEIKITRNKILSTRWDETWHRLQKWTNGQAPSERLAAQILISQGFNDLDPSHPLGGPDGGKDAVCYKNGQKWLMAVYFPRGQQNFTRRKRKFIDDFKGVERNGADGIAFVTNQEFSLAERDILTQNSGSTFVEIYHIDRITTILDDPKMASIRKQFLKIDTDDSPMILGGEGGQSPGAGGGGGSAIGDGAIGGPGGPGGNVNIADQLPIPPYAGAGGGGGAAIGDDAIGGEGGGGGDVVSGTFFVEDLLKMGGTHLEVEVGRRGEGIQGRDGEDGGDSVLNLVTDNGEKIELVRAKGGKGGRSGWTLNRQRAATSACDGKVKISTALLANYAEIREGLIHMLGAGWISYGVSSLPTPISFCFLFVVEADIGSKHDLLVEIIDPESTILYQELISVKTPESTKIPRVNMIIQFVINILISGIHSIKLIHGSNVLVETPFEIINSIVEN